jgi:hypothetical protein
MASLQASLATALREMAQCSYTNVIALTAVMDPLAITTHSFFDAEPSAQQLAALLPSLPDLLHVAGWLSPCTRPSMISSLPAYLIRNAHLVCTYCMNMAINCLLNTPAMDPAAFQRLLNPRSKPQVPGKPPPSGIPQPHQYRPTQSHPSQHMWPAGMLAGLRSTLDSIIMTLQLQGCAASYAGLQILSNSCGSSRSLCAAKTMPLP